MEHLLAHLRTLGRISLARLAGARAAGIRRSECVDRPLHARGRVSHMVARSVRLSIIDAIHGCKDPGVVVALKLAGSSV